MLWLALMTGCFWARDNNGAWEGPCGDSLRFDFDIHRDVGRYLEGEGDTWLGDRHYVMAIEGEEEEGGLYLDFDEIDDESWSSSWRFVGERRLGVMEGTLQPGDEPCRFERYH